MSAMAERMEGVPPASEKVEDIFLYGVAATKSEEAEADQIVVLVYAFCYQGHCYRLSIPAQYKFKPGSINGEDAEGCGFDGSKHKMWLISKTTDVTRIEKRAGTAEELILDINLPGQNPASMTYSAKVAIAGNAGKVYE